MRKLKIAQIAPLWYKIPPESYGGTERVVYNLTEGLVKKGHEVTLFAAGDAKTSARLIPTYKRSLRSDRFSWNEYNYPLLNIAKAFERADKFDIIHSHVDEFALFFTKLVDTPVVSTTHNPFDRRDKERPPGRMVVYDYFYPHPLVSISKAQKEAAKIKGNFIGTVYNGIDLKLYSFNPGPKDHFIWVSRFGAHKGPLEAIKAAKLAKEKLILAGHLDPENVSFFHKYIEPNLNVERVQYVGAINEKQKSKFFGQAKALLYPINWEEPFGLVMIEAMACGTPVIAFGRGSVPEIIRNGKNGFIVRSIREMASAIKKIDAIDRKVCRKYVEKYFSVDRMVEDYEKIYHRIISKHKRKRK